MTGWLIVLLVLVFCFMTKNYFETVANKFRCRYCGGEMGTHEQGCPNQF